jgi:hypothetical protein
MYPSVTTVIHKFVKPFDKDRKAQEYYEGHYHEEGFLERFPTVDHVLEAWDYKNKHAIFEGSTLHNYLENYIINKVMPYPDFDDRGKIRFEEIRESYVKMEAQANRFYQDYVASGKLLPIRSELVMGSESIGICGMCDQIFWSTKNKCFVIFDWKTNTSFNFENKYREKMLYCLDHLDKCEINTYSIQVELYKRIIETETALRFPYQNFVVWFNENNQNYQLIPLKDMKAVVDEMLIFWHQNRALFENNSAVHA